MVYQKEQVLISKGVFHVYMRTDAIAEHDAKRILFQYHQLWRHCDQSRVSFNLACGPSLLEVRELTLKSVSLIEEKTSRNLTEFLNFFMSKTFYTPYEISKRSDKFRININQNGNDRGVLMRKKRDDGWFWRLIHWAFDFGTSDINNSLNHDRSSGAIIHTVESVKNMGKTLVRNENMMDLEIRRLHREINYQRVRGNDLDRNAVETQFHRASDIILHYINRVMLPYEENPINSEELIEIVKKVDLQVINKNARVPSLHISDLKRLIKIKYHYERSVVYSIELPLVSFDSFHRMVVVPFPDQKTNSIRNFNVTDVIINAKDQQYLNLDEIEIRTINHSLSIVDTKIINRITEQTNCAIRMAALPNQICGVVPLESEYELINFQPFVLKN